MKYVRFLPQGNPKADFTPPTSPAYRTSAVDWWGSELPADARWVKGQFFWGRGPTAAAVLLAHLRDRRFYANAFVTFDESSESRLLETGEGWIAEQTQTVPSRPRRPPGPQ